MVKDYLSLFYCIFNKKNTKANELYKNFIRSKYYLNISWLSPQNKKDFI